MSGHVELSQGSFPTETEQWLHIKLMIILLHHCPLNGPLELGLL